MREEPKITPGVEPCGASTRTLEPMSEPLEPQEITSTGTSVLEREELREEASPGDAERYAHYVKKDKITSSTIEGGPVVALCGKVWTPSRDPKKYPVCPECKEIYEGLSGGGDGDKGGRGFFGFGGSRK